MFAASRGYTAARGIVNVGKRRNVASIQSYSFLAKRNEPSVADHKTEHGVSKMRWRGISYCSSNNGIPLTKSSNDDTSLSEMSKIRLITVMPIFEEDDGG